MKKVKLLLATGLILFSFSALAPQSAEAFDCERKFENKVGWKNRFLARGCKGKDNRTCRLKTQGCGANISIGNIAVK